VYLYYNLRVFFLLIFLTNGDSTAVDSVITYKIPEIIEPLGDMHPVGEIAVGYYDQTTLDMLMGLPVAPLAYGYGNWSTVMNKGRKPSYTRVSVNGHMINTYLLGCVNLGLLPLHYFERLAFGHTASGAEFSSVNFVSKINRYERPYSLARFMFASFESNEYGFDLTRGITNDLGFYLSGAHYKTDGHRENADAQLLSVYANVYANYFLPMRFDVMYANADYGYPGSTTMSVEGRQKDEFLDVSGTTRLGKEILTVFYERQTLDYRDTVNDRTWGVKLDHFGAASEGRDTLLGVSMHYGANFFVTLMEGEAYLSDISHGFDVSLRLEKSFGRGYVRAGGRIERSDYHNPILMPRCELGIKTLGSAEVYAAFLGDARSPSELETSAPLDSLNPYLTIVGNGSLEPEYCWCGEIGLRSDRYVLNAYRIRFNDYITVFTEFPGFFRYGNLDTWEIQGIEAYVNLPLRTYSSDSSRMTEFVVGLAGNVTVSQDSAPRYPMLVTGAFASFRRDTPRLGFGLKLRAEFSSETYDISGAEYSGYTVFSVAGLVKFMSLSCVLRVDNVFDEDYAYVPYYPMPPRNFSVSVKWEFWD
jgi:outer membrane receptor protein involved in Fe transport